MQPRTIGLIALALALSACATEPKQIDETQAMAEAGTRVAPARPAIESTVTKRLADVGDRVFFAYDRWSVPPDGERVLQQQAAWLKSHPNATFSVEGHSDERGTREYNLALGQRRADAVRAYLEALGVESRRIRTVSFGKERPDALGSEEAAWSRNRRAVTVVD